MKGKTTSQETKNMIAALYLQDVPLKKIRDLFNVSQKTIRRTLLEKGLVEKENEPIQLVKAREAKKYPNSTLNGHWYMKCLKPNENSFYTKNKIYEVNNFGFVCDDGDEINELKSFHDWDCYSSSDWELSTQEEYEQQQKEFENRYNEAVINMETKKVINGNSDKECLKALICALIDKVYADEKI